MILPTSNPTKSFWIEAAHSDLRDHRTTPELPKETDVVIVGSGYTGASAAYWLNKMSPEGQTPSMVMLEARGICEAATGRNGGLLRPHTYSRYTPWAAKWSPEIAHALIAFEVSHLDAFEELMKDEGFAEEVSYKSSETYDAPVTQEAWTRLKGAYDHMVRDHGKDDYLVKQCRLIENAAEAEEYTQMKGAVAAVIHPSGQVWAYKFVHALIRLVMKSGKLNVQANTPCISVNPVDAEGWIVVNTERGSIKTRKVIHATNRWAGQLLNGNYDKLIFPGRGTLCAVKATEGLMKVSSGGPHWDHVVNDYLVQLPPPHNVIVLGGGKPQLVHYPREYLGNDDETVQAKGIPEYFHSWPQKRLLGWKGEEKAEFVLPDEEGGVWTGIYSMTVDGAPFVGPVPGAEGQFMSAGYGGHGMPRILGCTAWLVPQVLESLNIKAVPSASSKCFTPLPEPFKVTAERLEALKDADPQVGIEADVEDGLRSSKKSWIETTAPGVVDKLVENMSNLVTTV